MPPRARRTPTGTPHHNDAHLSAPKRVLEDALNIYRATPGFAESAPDPFTLLHTETRKVQKDGITVGTVEFWAPELRRYVSTPGHDVVLEVRFDAAAADRRHLTEIFAVVDAKRLREIPPIRCIPRASAQDTRNRNEEANQRWLYEEELRAAVAAAKIGSARLSGGEAAANRARDLETLRAHQGRAGQEQSGLGAPRPEVDEGVKAHAAAQLKKKLKNSRIPAKPATGAKPSPSTPTASARPAVHPQGAADNARKHSSSSRATPASGPRGWGDVAATRAADAGRSKPPRGGSAGDGSPPRG